MAKDQGPSDDHQPLPIDFTDWHFCHTTGALSDAAAPAWGRYVGDELKRAFPGASVTWGEFKDWETELDIAAPGDTPPEVVAAVRSAAERVIRDLADRIVKGAGS